MIGVMVIVEISEKIATAINMKGTNFIFSREDILSICSRSWNSGFYLFGSRPNNH